MSNSFTTYAVRALSPFLFLALFITHAVAQQLPDIVFVTQTPHRADFVSVTSAFGNHRGDLSNAPRGGDLYIRYSDGTLKNLTASAGFGTQGFQGPEAIAVRDPSVHWDGKKVIFSMVRGSPARISEVAQYRWQLYEITGLGKNENPVITKVQNQPEGFNNVMPIYGSDDRIIFVSDRPRNGAAHLYPQLDEYESAQSNTGIWSLDRTQGDLKLLDHSPSGDFHPTLDSAGRIVFTRWDHLQRDQQADRGGDHGAKDYLSESPNASSTSPVELFPEPRSEQQRVSQSIALHSFNHFFPWEVHQDGTGLESLNHVGRHELIEYFDRTFQDDDSLSEFIADNSGRKNRNPIRAMFHIAEDPARPGFYLGVDGPEFGTHTAGQIIGMNSPKGLPASDIEVSYFTHRATSEATSSPSSNHSGLYRDPLPLSSGEIIVVHTTTTHQDRTVGSPQELVSSYRFRIKRLVQSGSNWIAGEALTPGISKSVEYFDPDTRRSYNGVMWELQPVALVPRARPARSSVSLERPERDVFNEEGVDVESFRTYLRERKLALVVSRNVTSRDTADRQQPFNVLVSGTNTISLSNSGRVYELLGMQFFQGDQVRAYSNLVEGRRVVARGLHDGGPLNSLAFAGDPSTVKIASDGSVAAIVPAERALSWQLVDPQKTPVVRERYWASFSPGEIRLCASCHGLNRTDQLGRSVPTNKPEALRQLLARFKAGSGVSTVPTRTPTAGPTRTPVRTVAPTRTPTRAPTTAQTPRPTHTPTPRRTAVVTSTPTPRRTVAPTATPSVVKPAFGLRVPSRVRPTTSMRVSVRVRNYSGPLTLRVRAGRFACRATALARPGKASFGRTYSSAPLPRIPGKVALRFDLNSSRGVVARGSTVYENGERRTAVTQQEVLEFCQAFRTLR